MKKIIFLVLNIYIVFTTVILAQKIYLNIEAEDSTKTALIKTLDYKSSFNDYNSLSAELDSLTIQLQHIGYINTIQSELNKKGDTLIASFLLNNKFDSITIDLTKQAFSLKQLRVIDPNASPNQITIPIKESKTALNYLNSLQIDKGTPFSSLRLTNIKTKDSTNLQAKLTSTFSQKRHIDKIIIKGYDKFPESYVRYGARIKKGQLFRRERLKRRARTLNTLNFAKTQKEPEILFTKDSTTVFLYLKKQKANNFDGFLGFSNDSETGDFELNGYLNLQLINNLNYGERLSLLYKADGGEQLQFKASLNLPYILKSPIGVILDLDIFRRDSTFVTVNQSAKLNYQLLTTSNLFLGYQGTTSNNLQDSPTGVNTVQDYDAQFITFGGNFIKPNTNLLFPTKYNLKASFEVGQRTAENNKDNQVRGILDADYLFTLNQRNFLYFRDIAGGVFSESFLDNELLRFGGILNMRGFEENSIDASIFNVIQSEYRYALSPTIYTHSVIDFGYYQNEVNSIEEQLLSFGIGLGLSTNSGFLKLVFANGRAGNQNFDFNNTKVHLSLIAQF